MCLAVPLALIDVSADRRTGTVSMAGAPREIGLDLVPEARPGDFVLIHAGMAIELLDEKEAMEILDMFRQFSDAPDQLAPEAGDGDE